MKTSESTPITSGKRSAQRKIRIGSWFGRRSVAVKSLAQWAELSEEHLLQVEDRKAAAMRHLELGNPAARLITTAPPGYLLAHESGDIARHCQLLSPLPSPGEVRVVVTPGRSSAEWHLDVASRDRPGFLAAFTGVLSDRYFDVAQAVIATWDDGTALEAFVIRSTTTPDAGSIQSAFEASLHEPLSSSPMFDARVTFDHEASPLYSRCDVRATDRVGLLHSVAVAIAAAGASVHAASVTTADGLALDRFDLSSQDGGKLDTSLEEAIEANVRNGVTARDTKQNRRQARRVRLA